MKRGRLSDRGLLAGAPKNSRPKAFLGGIYGIQLLAGILLTLNLTLLFGIFISSKGVIGYRQQSQMVADLETKIQKLKADNQRAFDRLQDLKKSPDVQERMVRRQLGWAREGELVIDFLPSGSEKSN
jgi:cell division protein FtsB